MFVQLHVQHYVADVSTSHSPAKSKQKLALSNFTVEIEPRRHSAEGNVMLRFRENGLKIDLIKPFLDGL